MPKIRVYELAKELNLSSKEVIKKIGEFGVDLSNHMSSVEDEIATRLRKGTRSNETDSGEIKPIIQEKKDEISEPSPKSPSPETQKISITNPESEGKPIPPPLRLDAEDKPIPPRPRLDAEGKPIPPRPRLDAEGKPIPPRPRFDAEGKPIPPRPRLDANGNPIPPRPRLDANGKPLPPRPRLDANGRPIPPRPRLDANGNPIPPRPRLDANGKPLPPRPRLDANGRPLPPRPRLDANGKPIPPRPRLDANGRPLPPRPRLDANGRPLPPRPRLDANGRPLPPRPRLDANGRPTPSRPHQDAENKHISPTPQIEHIPKEVTSSETRDVSKSSEAAPIPESKPQTAQQIELKRDPAPSTDSQNRQAKPRQDNRPPRPMRPGGSDRPRPQGQGGFDRPRPQGQGGFDRQRPGVGQGGINRPPRPQQGQGGQRPGGGFDKQRPYQGGQRPGGTPGGFNKPRPGGGGQAVSGKPRQGGPGRGGFDSSPQKEDKKTEPTKDDKRTQWNKSQIANQAKKDKKDNERKENRQALDRRGSRPGKPAKKVMPVKVMPVVEQITVAAEITVRDLAEKLLRSNADIIKILMKKGIMVTANQKIDFDTAQHVAETYGVLVDEYVEVDVFKEAFANIPDKEETLLPRPPVVVVMGHVDHGKTSLLDVIRNANVQQSEAGGITQHIGAYSVNASGKMITFLDTPGHEAFTAMRMRGAQVTDIAILVVAADDGVMPQTVEAINHAKAAGVEIIVAINKMDKPGANPDRVKTELAEKGLQAEDWGGATITVPVSALKREGIDHLLEMILLAAEMKELKANPNKPARGSIIEAKLDKGRGPVATVLVQEGTLNIGDPIVAGACFGKVRAMTDSRGRSLKQAGPSTPVEIIGLAEVPTTGDILYAAQSDRQARQLSETVVAKGRENMIKATQGKVSLDDLFNQIQAGQVKDLNIVVKADVQGSVEALRGSLEKLTNESVRVRIIHTGVGAISESDVMLASASNAIILGFNVRPDASAKSVSESENVDIRLYSVIYSAIDDIEAAMKGMLDPEFVEKVIGQAEIRQIFKASGVGTIGGCYVTEGKITRNAKVRLIRDGRVIYDGTLETLRRFKDDVREVAQGYECGMLFKNYNDIKELDKVEAYIMEEVPR